MKRTAPYGTWKSPISAALAAKNAPRFDGTISDIRIDGSDVYWTELRPEEGGRCAIFKHSPDGTISVMTPEPFNVRTQVHTYGGAPYAVRDGVIYFSNFADGQIYRQQGCDTPCRLTNDNAMRFADLVVGDEMILCVCERHHPDTMPDNLLAWMVVRFGLVGYTLYDEKVDFVSSPRLNANKTRLAYISWNHPNMPWDETTLHIVPNSPEFVSNDSSISLARPHVSHTEPMWGPDGNLYFVSDETGWWNLYRYRPIERQFDALCPMKAEFTRPHWTFGMQHYDFVGNDKIVCAYTRMGSWRLGLLDITNGKLERLYGCSYTDIRDVHAAGKNVYFVGGSAEHPESLVRLDLTTMKYEVLRQSGESRIDREYVSIPIPFEFPTEGGLTAHALYYPPTNKDFEGPEGEKPPCIVRSHGGPTSQASTLHDLAKLYYTSRGIAVVDVDYGGSTGYGRDYRERLKGTWGIVDVQDCINAALFLVDKGLIDPKRLVIKGGSAAGYTTLRALTTSGVFSAGISHYGVSDLESLMHDTHKFEAHYLEGLIAPYPAQADLYRERSPIHHLDQLSAPMLLLQGSEDKAVPPNQAEMMATAVRSKGLPVAYILFEGEGHGFRKLENQIRTLEAELYFLSRVFGFKPADDLPQIQIDNM